MVKCSEHFVLNKCSVLFIEMFITVDRGLLIPVFEFGHQIGEQNLFVNFLFWNLNYVLSSIMGFF